MPARRQSAAATATVSTTPPAFPCTYTLTFTYTSLEEKSARHVTSPSDWRTSESARRSRSDTRKIDDRSPPNETQSSTGPRSLARHRDRAGDRLSRGIARLRPPPQYPALRLDRRR